MTTSEREGFLRRPLLGVLAAVDHRPEHGAIATPLFYSAHADDIRIYTRRDNIKTASVRETGRATLCVATQEWPYEYVTVEGPAGLADRTASDDEDYLAMLVRYLGAQAGQAYFDSDLGRADDTVLKIRPQHWAGVSFA